MDTYTFQSFALDFTKLSECEFTAASERYFRYRGMDPKIKVVEKHFIEFLHFLDLEELFREYHYVLKRMAEGSPAAVPPGTVRKRLRKNTVRLHESKILGRAKRALTRLNTLEVE